MITTATIAAYYRVSEEQMSMAHRIVDMAARQIFFVVESATSDSEYKVIYNRQLKALQCLPFTGQPCKASQHGLTCWHKRAACAVAAEYRLEQERDMDELSREMEQETREYTIEVDPTSCSLDGVKWERAGQGGRLVPMR